MSKKVPGKKPPQKKDGSPAPVSMKGDVPPDQYHTKKCPSCGTWNANRANTCAVDTCGAELPSKAGDKSAKVGKVKSKGKAPAFDLKRVQEFVGRFGKGDAGKALEFLESLTGWFDTEAWARQVKGYAQFVEACQTGDPEKILAAQAALTGKAPF